MELDQSIASDSTWHVTHALADEDRIFLNNALAAIASHKGKLRGVAARVPFNEMMRQIISPKGISFRQDTVGGIPGWWCEPSGARPGAVLLYAHGGWFNLGSAEAYLNFVGHIAGSANTKAFVPDYRLAPEHPFPSGLEDIIAAYTALAKTNNAIALAGDSAGGNLALVLLSQINQHTSTHPSIVGAVAISPVTDLAMTGSSWQSRAEAEPYFVREQVEELLTSYLQGHDPLDAKVSPLYGDLIGLPPVQVYVGDNEVLLDDAVRYVQRAVAANVDAQLHVWEGMPHVFPTSIGKLKAADKAMKAIGDFLSECFSLAAR